MDGIGSFFTRKRVYLMIGIWLAVYPSVTLLTYLTQDMPAPLYLRTVLTTALTVPFITFAVVPVVDRLIEKARQKKEQLKRGA